MGYNPVLSLFCCLNCSSFGHQEMFTLALVPFKHVSVSFLSISLLSGTTRSSRIIFYFRVLVLKTTALQGTLITFIGEWYLEIKNRALDVLIATGVSLFLGPLSRQIWEIYMSKNLDIYTSLCVSSFHICIYYTHKHAYCELIQMPSNWNLTV